MLSPAGYCSAHPAAAGQILARCHHLKIEAVFLELLLPMEWMTASGRGWSVELSEALTYLVIALGLLWGPESPRMEPHRWPRTKTNCNSRSLTDTYCCSRHR